MSKPELTSPYYPYYKVHESYCDLSDTVNLPKKICDYLIDAPQGGYTPQNNNKLPRCRFWKYLYYDTEKPLTKTLPTIKQKLQLVFNADKPENPPTDKGYRLIPELFIKPSQVEAQTRVHVCMGRTLPSSDEYRISLSVIFYIWTHYTTEANTKSDAYSRAFAIEQAIIEAFHGVNMAGVGTFYFSKNKHADCGSKPIFDGNTNVGRELTIALEVATTNEQDFAEVSNMLTLDDTGLKLI